MSTIETAFRAERRKKRATGQRKKKRKRWVRLARYILCPLCDEYAPIELTKHGCEIGCRCNPRVWVELH
jgi:hypothetical protein